MVNIDENGIIIKRVAWKPSSVDTCHEKASEQRNYSFDILEVGNFNLYEKLV